MPLPGIEGASLLRGLTKRPRVTATLQLRGPITYPQGQPPARTFSFPQEPAVFPSSSNFHQEEELGVAKKKTVREPPVT